MLMSKWHIFSKGLFVLLNNEQYVDEYTHLEL